MNPHIFNLQSQKTEQIRKIAAVFVHVRFYIISQTWDDGDDDVEEVKRYKEEERPPCTFSLCDGTVRL